MAAGDFPSGGDPAGEDPIQVAPPKRNVTLPAALHLDGATMSFPMDANGRYLSVHPVDQRVAIKLLVPLKSIGSAPGTGNTLGTIPRFANSKRETTARQIVQTLLAPDVKAGDIEIVSIEVDTSIRYATLVRTTYKNLRLPNATAKTITSNVSA